MAQENIENNYEVEKVSYEQEYELIKRYVTLRPHSSKIEICGNTRIPMNLINKFIEEGLFEEKEGELVLPTKRKERISIEDKKKIVNELNNELKKDEEEKITSQKAGQSKLVQNLNELYGRKSKSRDER